MFEKFDPKGPDAAKRWREVFNPQAVDQMIRRALQMLRSGKWGYSVFPGIIRGLPDLDGGVPRIS